MYPFDPQAVWIAWHCVYVTTPMISGQKYLLSYKSVYQILRQIAMGQRAFASGRKNLFLFVLTHTWMCILHRFPNFCLWNLGKSWILSLESYCCSRRFYIYVTRLQSPSCLIINMIKTLNIVVIQKNESKIKASKMNIQKKETWDTRS